MSGCKAFAPLLLAACTVASAPAHAQYEVDEDNPVWLRALLDVRVARGGSAPSWTDHGPGKTRYGGRSTDAGFERVTRLALAQFAHSGRRLAAVGHTRPGASERAAGHRR